MRSPVNCPFEPGSDHVPQIWAGRARELADAEVVEARRLAGVYERGRAYLGEFGSGKSVLINRVAASARAAGHWVPPRVRVSRGGDPLALLATVFGEFVAAHDLDARIGRRVRGLLDRVEEIRLPAGGGGVRTRRAAVDPNRHRVITELLLRLGSAAREATTGELPHGRLIVLRIDEIQNTSPDGLSQLLTALGDALDATTTETDVAGIARERLLPIAVYVSGLPDFGTLAARAGATFSRRFKTDELEPLSDADLRAALAPFTHGGWPLLTADGPMPVHMEPEAVDVIATRCLGDPFLFQLAGEAAWNAGTGAVISGEEADRGWLSARREITRYAAARLEGLSELQVQYLEAVVALAPEARTAAAVATRLGRPSSRGLGSTAQALENDRRLIRRRAGRVAVRSQVVEAYLQGGWP